jgi:hypothetical protein
VAAEHVVDTPALMQHHNPWPGPGSNRPRRHDGATIDDDVNRTRFHVRHASDRISATRRDMQNSSNGGPQGPRSTPMTLGLASVDEWMAFVKDSEGNTIGLASHHMPEHF